MVKLFYHSKSNIFMKAGVTLKLSNQAAKFCNAGEPS